MLRTAAGGGRSPWDGEHLDGQANRVHINGKTDLSGKLYHQSLTAIAKQEDYVASKSKIIFTVVLVNATDKPYAQVSLSCKAFGKDGTMLLSTARDVSGGVKALATTALEWAGGLVPAMPAGEVSAACEIARP